MASIESARPIHSPHRFHPLNPFRVTFDAIGYLGRVALLGLSALRAIIRPVGPTTSFVSETSRQFESLLGMGLPTVALVHVGMGSFLAMQAYFGATFLDGIGPIVGVGLIRNLAPLLTGFILTGLISARYVGEFRGLTGEASADPGRLACTRVAAAVMAGPILAAWGAGVGTAVGFLIARSMMDVTVPAFFDMMLEMLWARDIVGLVCKGAAFGGLAALLACHEGLARSAEGSASDPAEAIVAAGCRAACLGGVAILVFNSGWFLLFYHAGPAFGPTVLTPPHM